MYKDKVCELCGRTFTPKGGVAKYCKLPIEKICIVCGKPFTTICHSKSNDVCDDAECKKKAGFVAATKSINRICRVCGNPFIANSSRQLDCGKKVVKKCEICGNEYSTKCGLRWQGHTCNSHKCKTEYAYRGQQAHFLSLTKTCVFCGKEFHPVNNKQIVCGNPHAVICKTCGKSFEVDAKYRPCDAPKYCSDECRTKGFESRIYVMTPESIEKMKQTKRKKYGNDYGAKAFAKGMQTYKDKTGYSHPIYNIETHYKRAKTRSRISSKDGKSFDSYYEVKVYDFLSDIPKISLQTQVPICYQYNGSTHSTWIDFNINNRLFEVKGEHLLIGVYDDLNIPIAVKLETYNDNNVIVITNNTDSAKEILASYPNIIGIDINIFNTKLPIHDRKEIWDKILKAISQDIKFIDSNSIK